MTKRILNNRHYSHTQDEGNLHLARMLVWGLLSQPAPILLCCSLLTEGLPVQPSLPFTAPGASQEVSWASTTTFQPFLFLFLPPAILCSLPFKALPCKICKKSFIVLCNPMDTVKRPLPIPWIKTSNFLKTRCLISSPYKKGHC